MVEKGSNNSERWIVLLELPNNSSKILSLGSRNLENPQYVPDIDLYRYGGVDNGIFQEHVVLNLNDGFAEISPASLTSTLYNNTQTQREQTVRLKDKDTFQMRNVTLIVKFEPNEIILGKDYQLFLMKHVPAGEETILNPQDLLDTVNIGEYQISRWVLERAELLVEKTGTSIEEALDTVSKVIQSERKPTKRSGSGGIIFISGGDKT